MKNIRLHIDRKEIGFSSNSPHLIRLIRSRVSETFLESYSRQEDIAVCFSLRKKLNHPRKLALAALYSQSNFERASVKVSCPILPPNLSWLYHVGFLQPLSLGLLRHQKSLLHGALVARDGEGTLLVGESGVGKSTLSLLCTLAGYTLFSDEHSILSVSDRRVWGSPFHGPVAVAGKSLAHFSSVPLSFVWSNTRRKFLVSALDVNSAAPNRWCRVKKVVFPEFSLRNRLSVQPLSAGATMRRLLKDEYVGLSTVTRIDRFTRTHLSILECLAQTSDCYAVKYGVKDVASMPEIIGTLK